MAYNILQSILEEGRALGIEDLTLKEKAARTWYKREAERIRYINENQIKEKWLNLTELDLKNRVVPGYMYLFMYEAKHKATLPYWDRYPLIFPIEKKDNGFLGINMHYLPHEYRAKLMDALYGLAFENKYDESVRLRISYEILKSSSRYKYFKPCVKRYLNSQLRSKFYMVDWKEWPTALFLPLEKFRSNWQFASPQKVWSDSVQKIDGKTGKK